MLHLRTNRERKRKGSKKILRDLESKEVDR